jgi:hypothetical protein
VGNITFGGSTLGLLIAIVSVTNSLSQGKRAGISAALSTWYDFGKSTVKRGHIEAMKGKYFHNVSIVRPSGESNVPLPEKDEVIRLHKMLVEVLKRFKIYLHQLTLEALIKNVIFIWAVRSQGFEPNVDCLYNIHELFYKTKATGKEQYHNNFDCNTFVNRSNAKYLVPTFR